MDQKLLNNDDMKIREVLVENLGNNILRPAGDSDGGDVERVHSLRGLAVQSRSQGYRIPGNRTSLSLSLSLPLNQC